MNFKRIVACKRCLYAISDDAQLYERRFAFDRWEPLNGPTFEDGSACPLVDVAANENTDGDVDVTVLTAGGLVFTYTMSLRDGWRWVELR